MGSWNVVNERIFAQAADPGAVGSGTIWTDTDANITYRRNDANTDWIPIALSLGTAYQNLSVNSGATAQAYQASMQSLLTAQGDIIYASAANTPARLAKGTAAQVLAINSGATAPEWVSSTSIPIRSTFTSESSQTLGDMIDHTVYLDLVHFSSSNPKIWDTYTGSYIKWFFDDLTSYADVTAGDTAYPTTNTAILRVNPTNDNIDIVTVDPNDAACWLYKDMAQAISETTWILQYKLVISTITVGAGNVWVSAGMSATTSGPGTAKDFIGFGVSLESGSTKDYNGFASNAGFQQTQGQGLARTAAAETLYVQIKRTSATAANVSIYSDSAYTTLLESLDLTGVTSAITGLRYFLVMAQGSGAGVNVLTATIDDVKFIDGHSSVP